MRILSNAKKCSDVGVTEDAWRRADKGFVFTRSGKRIYFLNIENTEFDILDICHGLAHNYRWNGATTRPWSVAQHSLLVSRMIEELRWNTSIKNLGIAQLKALTHDFTEAYLGDVATPIKRELELYNHIEDSIEQKVEETIDIHKSMNDEIRELVKRADTLSLIIEALTIVKIDDKYKEYCLRELETSYSDVRGIAALEKYRKDIVVENPDYVAGKLLVELHRQCKNMNRDMKCFKNISNKTLEEDGVIPIYEDGILKYRVFNFGKSVNIKREEDRRNFNISKVNFDNMISIDLIESMEK